MQLVYFAAVREALGRDAEPFLLPGTVTVISELLDYLVASGSDYARAFADRDKLRFAIDQQMVKIDASLAGAQELAIFPPVTGG